MPSGAVSRRQAEFIPLGEDEIELVGVLAIVQAQDVQPVEQQQQEPYDPTPHELHQRVLQLREAQAAVARLSDLKGSATCVKTSRLVRSDPAPEPMFLYYGNAETFYLIGDAFGKAMVDLLRESR